MGSLFELVAVAAGIGIVASSFTSIARPREALALLKRLGLTLAYIILGAALLQKILAEVPGAGSVGFLALLVASPVAYCIREAGRKKPVRKSDRRARERMRAEVWHHGGQAEDAGEEE